MSKGKKIFILFLNILIIAGGWLAATIISREEVAARGQESPDTVEETKIDDDITVKSNVIDVFNEGDTSGTIGEDSGDYTETESYADEEYGYEEPVNNDDESPADSEDPATAGDTPEEGAPDESGGTGEPAAGPDTTGGSGTGTGEGESQGDAAGDNNDTIGGN